ncbi:DHA2 family efflux MFS transporter permease subunit [Paenibacillus vulneris]|uniref:DHA2 family efflux MFS transporter permease subunit n=1 Tax=Paenibacillus vulneris TaxID=1133364 RepID=A0ABW3UVC6_9BACL|nr:MULTISPECIES: DHA2 family efflux MFS transporter permease subunit [unclassified Paenibacillus]MBE1443621.1 EmrB/QacA subfamily drug resistance transporter [Paenibacillus sp. OAS669]
MENISIGRTLTVLMAGAFVAILNQTLISVAIPHMMNDFNVSATTIQWLTTAYMLVNGVLIPITAFLIETYGTRALFLFAMVAFTVGALICAIAPSFSIILFGRIIQAIGAGVLMPLITNVFLAVFPPEKRGAAMGMMGIVMVFAPAVGPTLAGWVVQNYTWRILFYAMLPLGILDILLATKWLKNVTKLSYPPFDLAGAIFSTIGFGALLYGFSEAGSKGWTSLLVVCSFFIGGIFLLLFIWRELTTDQPLLNLSVFKYDVFTMSTIIGAAVNMAMLGAMILLPIYLQNIRGFTPLQSGLLLLPGALIMGVMSPISGALFDRMGARPLAIVGLIITAITTLEFSRLTDDSTYGHIMLLYTVRMFGMSMIMMTVQTAGLNQLPRQLGSHGTAMSNTTRQVAGSIGTALLVTVMSSRTTVHLGNYSNELTTSNPILMENVTQFGQQLALASGQAVEAGSTLAIQTLYSLAATHSTISGINDSFLVATLITVIALFFSLFLRRAKHAEPKS